MKVLLLAFLLSGIYGKMLVTKEDAEYLKKHVSWEVVEYEDNIFKGWTEEEAKTFLGATQPDYEKYIPSIEEQQNLPSSFNWHGSNCDHGVRNQGQCGSCWAVATAGMLSDRCCLGGHDHGWLSPQQLLSCDKKSKGCNGGWPTWALDYVISNNGLVVESCFPYKAQNIPCPNQCVDGKKFESFCNCTDGYKTANTVEKIKTALQKGPITIGFGVCNSFFHYGTRIYKCDCNKNYVGLHAVMAMGYGTDPECYLHMKNSWGTSWGRSGYFEIACNTCGIPNDYPNGNVFCDKVEP